MKSKMMYLQYNDLSNITQTFNYQKKNQIIQYNTSSLLPNLLGTVHFSLQFTRFSWVNERDVTVKILIGKMQFKCKCNKMNIQFTACISHYGMYSTPQKGQNVHSSSTALKSKGSPKTFHFTSFPFHYIIIICFADAVTKIQYFKSFSTSKHTTIFNNNKNKRNRNESIKHETKKRRYPKKKKRSRKNNKTNENYDQKCRKIQSKCEKKEILKQFTCNFYR